MPLYEYICQDCQAHFDLLRSIKDADTPIACPTCKGEHTRRAISVFFAQSSGKSIAGSSGSSGCAGCSGGSCAGCGH